MLGPCSSNKYTMKQSAFQEDVAQNIDIPLHLQNAGPTQTNQ